MFLFASKPILKALLPLNFMYHSKNLKMPLSFLVSVPFFPIFFTLECLRQCYLVCEISEYIIQVNYLFAIDSSNEI